MFNCIPKLYVMITRGFNKCCLNYFWERGIHFKVICAVAIVNNCILIIVPNILNLEGVEHITVFRLNDQGYSVTSQSGIRGCSDCAVFSFLYIYIIQHVNNCANFYICLRHCKGDGVIACFFKVNRNLVKRAILIHCINFNI